jgi:hypothetical protein
MRRSGSKTSLNGPEPPAIINSFPSTLSLPSSSSTYLTVDLRSPTTPHSEFSPLPIVQAANAALTMERTPFAIDDSRDDDDDDDDYDTDEETEDGKDDDLVLDEVRFHRHTHDFKLISFSLRLMLFWKLMIPD